MSSQAAPADVETRHRRILVTGATGYVGGRLVPALLEAGYQVRCLVRSPRKLEQRTWHHDSRVEIVQGDLACLEDLSDKLAGCTAAYYLVHAMLSAGAAFAEKDQMLAGNFSQAARMAGLERIIYLGGLGELGADLSHHLRSRREVELALAENGIPVTTLRAAMIVGAGSASFEILRYLVERLPIMITPRWVDTPCQPVSIRDVLDWLVRCLEVPETVGQVIDIGGPDVLSYRELMKLTAEELTLRRRWIIGVPVLTPRLSSGWISLITPVSYQIARPLAEGLRNKVVVDPARSAQRLMPHQPLPMREAIRRAISLTEEQVVETRWSAAGPIPGDPDWAGGKVFVDQRDIEIKANPDTVYRAVCRVGGGHGWYAGDILWRLRGWMDQILGGPGLRRGRRHPEDVEFGEALDFWRVVGLEPGRKLLLHAEMKLPGTARLEFNIHPVPNTQSTRLTMTARFRPRGLVGIAYWYAVCPLHQLVFGGMLRGIQRAAEA